MVLFEQNYAKQTIKNTQALFERGFGVQTEHKGFTESHQVLFNATNNGGGAKVAKLLNL